MLATKGAVVRGAEECATHSPRAIADVTIAIDLQLGKSEAKGFSCQRVHGICCGSLRGGRLAVGEELSLPDFLIVVNLRFVHLLLVPILLLLQLDLILTPELIQL